jgi:hypothetical protein
MKARMCEKIAETEGGLTDGSVCPTLPANRFFHTLFRAALLAAVISTTALFAQDARQIVEESQRRARAN